MKRILTSAICIAMAVFFLAACATADSREKRDAAVTVLTAMRNFDSETYSANVELNESMRADEIFMNDAGEQFEELMEAIFSQVSWNLGTARINDDGRGSITATIRAIDVGALIVVASEEVQVEYEFYDLIIEKISNRDFEWTNTEVEIIFEKIGDEWKVVVNEELVAAFAGNL